jgi:hypothetical protein
MLLDWMRSGSRVRPWMVAMALACAAGSGCKKSEPAAGAEAGAGSPQADCEPNDIYGPAPCTSDEECRREGGPGWVCGPEPLKYDDGCGRTVTWGPVCNPAAGTGASAPATGPAAPPPAPLPRLLDVGPAEE